MEREGGGEYEPDFTMPQHEAVREDSWAEYASHGFTVVWDGITNAKLFKMRWEQAKSEFGSGNVFTGDAFDESAGRPLRHKPGVGIYVSRDGLNYRDERRTQRSAGSDPGPTEEDLTGS